MKRIVHFVSTLLTMGVLGLHALLPATAYAAGTFSRGDGTEENPYSIANCDQLQAMSDDLTAHYKLAVNIDCYGFDFQHVGDSTTAFSGTLEGNNKIIKDLNVDDFGLFGKIQGGTVQNLMLKNPTVIGTTNVGMLAGIVLGAGTTISNVHVVNGTVTGTSNYIGGMVGAMGLNNPVLQKSSFTGTVTSPGVMGGFVGDATGAAYIYNNYVQANLTVSPGDSAMVGGFVAIAASNQIGQNYAVVTVDAQNAGFNSTVGGFGGLGSGWIQTSFADMAYNTGAANIGDFLGTAAGLTVNGNYYATHGHQWASNTNAGGGVTSVDTGTNPTWFQTATNAPFTFGWDFENTWQEVEGDYPKLRGQTAFSEVTEDLNGDNVDDSYQANVIGVPDDEANLTTVELDANSPCTLDPAGSWIDSGYYKADPYFPLQIPRMTAFTVYCPTAGAQVTVTLIYPEQYDTSNSVLRFYDDVANEYHNVSGVSFGTRSINSQTVTTATYTLIDGGENDTDGLANGIIEDPVGIAVNNTPTTNNTQGTSGGSSAGGSSNLATTGQSTSAVSELALIMLVMSSLSIIVLLKISRPTTPINK